MIHINRNRQSLGQFSEQYVADGLRSGKFLPSDLAWRPGMDAWQPLSAFSDLPPPEISGTEKSPSLSAVVPTWENPSGGSFFSSAYQSARGILSQPSETFRAMPTEGGLGKPLAFYLSVSWLTSAIAVLYQAIAATVNPEMVLPREAASMSGYAIPLIYLAALIFLPALLLVGVFVSSGLIHLGLVAVGGARKPFEATFRALCYSGGATSVLQLIPLCGGWLSSIAWLVYSVIALKEVHRTETWRPVAAIALVFFAFCGVVVAAAVLLALVTGVAGGVLQGSK